MKDSKLIKYHNRAMAIGSESHDTKTQVAALLINKSSGAVIADGFNGFVRGAPDHSLPNYGTEKYKYVIHAEVNMICNAARHGVSMAGCVVYSTLSPCTSCARMLYQAGIEDVYFKDIYIDLSNSQNMGDLDINVTKKGDFWHMQLTN